MITLYSAKIFRAKKLSLVLGVCLTGIYGFVFVTLQLKDYALLMGSIGLALILAATMYLTRNIDWYGLKIGEVGKAGGSEEMRK
jgi:inner membrane protein